MSSATGIGQVPASRSPGVATRFAPTAALADAILYEGYLLYPYRRSSGKNKVRWQFGVLLPRPWAEAQGLDDVGVAGSAESWWQQTECLLEGSPGEVHVRLRFLQPQRRTVQRNDHGRFVTVDRLEVNGRHELTFDEAAAHEIDVTVHRDELLAGGSVTPVDLSADVHVEPVVDPAGGAVGRVVRRREAMSAVVRVSADICNPAHPVLRLRLRVENTTGDVDPAADRDDAVRHALTATHTLLATTDGSFVSLLDPPDWATDAARGCRNVHTFPVLAGPDGSDDVVLSAPIILYDHPRVAPESPGDLHDATEIDEILSLRTLTLTDEEKAEARATDPRAAGIVDRVDLMPPEIFGRLHGAIRSLQPTGSAASPTAEPTPWWSPEADTSVSPDADSVVVAGVHVRKGSRVRLRPRVHGTDVHDMFLVGRTAVVEAVLTDVDDARHVVVTVEDDPAADLNRWYGRYRYFDPDEVVPLDADQGADR